MSENYISQTDLAKKLKISKQAINKVLRNGIIIKHKVGKVNKIDLDCPKTKAYIKNSTSARHVKQTPKPQSKPKPPAPSKEVKDTTPTSPEYIESAKAYMDKQDIERLKKLQETQKLELHNAKARGELIERETVQAFVNALHEIDNGQWKTLGLKIATDIAAEFGIDNDEQIRRACDVVDREVYSILKQVKRMQNSFLKKIGAKKIPKGDA